MKILKRTALLLSVIIFSSIFSMSSMAGEVDCSNPKGFHQKYVVCKMKLGGGDVSSAETTKPKKKGWLHKIRTFGGSTVGGED